MTRWLALTLFFLTATSAKTLAQVAPKTSAPSTAWPREYSSELDGKIDIVTITDPIHRQHCENVQMMKPDSIVCNRSKNKPQTIYSREDILALISPPTHGILIYMSVLIGIATADIAASFFVPLAASVVLRVLAGLVFWTGPVGLIGAPTGHNGDIVVYQKEGSTLAVPLRGHHAH